MTTSTREQVVSAAPSDNRPRLSVLEGGRPLAPRERLERLCDQGSLQVIRSAVVSDAIGAKAEEGDGVVGAAGRIRGRPVFCYAQDSRFRGGSVGVAHADTIVRVQRLARKAGVPLVAFVESAGARLQEGVAALNAYARIFAEHVAGSGQAPQISVITGAAAGGASFSPALTDFVIMTERASMFLTGPGVVREVTGEHSSLRDLGGAQVHERNGVCQLVVDNDPAAISLVRQLLSYLPQNACSEAPAEPSREPEDPHVERCLPSDPSRPYDVRHVARGLVDAGSLLEICPSWAPNLVTALARFDGRPVGVVASQPSHLGGALDAEAAQKGARFVKTCDRLGLPLVVLVDTPGFLLGSDQEAQGVIRHGATLLRAFAAATVARVTVVLRTALGGAYVAMNSKDLGADLTLAWPGAQIGVMAAEHAVGVIHRARLADAPPSRRRALADAYASAHLDAESAARAGHIDEIITPAETRERVVWALAALPMHGRRVRDLQR
jgi:acetyl-CoA carboxylase carboxyltransferase component